MKTQVPSPLLRVALRHFFEDQEARLQVLLAAARDSEALPPDARFDVSTSLWQLPSENGKPPAP